MDGYMGQEITTARNCPPMCPAGTRSSSTASRDVSSARSAETRAMGSAVPGGGGAVASSAARICPALPLLAAAPEARGGRGP